MTEYVEEAAKRFLTCAPIGVAPASTRCGLLLREGDGPAADDAIS
jgi:hypothetical protein